MKTPSKAVTGAVIFALLAIIILILLWIEYKMGNKIKVIAN